MCTGLDEKKQNELYLLAKEMEKTQLLRDKVTAGMYDSRTTHLVVGPSFGKTDKLLCALAAGIPIVHAEYVKKSHKKGDWLALGLVGSYDVGRPTEQLNRLLIPTPIYLINSLFSGCTSHHWQRGRSKRREGESSKVGLLWCCWKMQDRRKFTDECLSWGALWFIGGP